MYMAHTNAWGSKFDLGGKKVKRQHRIIILVILVDLLSPIIYAKIRAQGLFGSGEEDFLRFSPYMGIAAILINGSRLSFILLPMEAPHEI